jgi:hypothetical protein
MDLKLKRDPVTEITDYCVNRIRTFIKDFPCDTLSELLANAETILKTRFVEVRTDEELCQVRDHYFKKGETEFALLEKELGPGVYAITFRRLCPAKGDREFISIIDCRREKAFRSYFSKWHELAHLLTLTDQGRLKFYRTHASVSDRDPEEVLMEHIAGEVGFLPDLINAHLTGDISFARIRQLRDRLCPEASLQSCIIGFVRNWPSACVSIEAGLRFKKSDERRLAQPDLGFLEKPTPELRISHITSSTSSGALGNLLHQNMRVPPTSVIHQVFSDEALFEADAVENLNAWETKKDGHLPNHRVRVYARSRRDAVEALIVPL